MTFYFLYEHSDISMELYTVYNLTAFSQNIIRVISNSLALKTYIN